MKLFSAFNGRESRLAVITGLSLFLSACSVLGIRTGTEQPPYALLGSVGSNVELRQYQERLAARVKLNNEGPEVRKRNAAFVILADYIFGSNYAKSKLSMTSPVASQPQTTSEKIAMTAPVSADTSNGEAYTMSFFLPKTITLENAPIPVDDRVELVEVPAKKMAALRFNGNWSEERVDEFKARLLQAIDLSEWQALDEPIAYFYDPPWTIPTLRRNEVVVTVGSRPTDMNGSRN